MVGRPVQSYLLRIRDVDGDPFAFARGDEIRDLVKLIENRRCLRSQIESLKANRLKLVPVVVVACKPHSNLLTSVSLVTVTSGSRVS